MQRLLITVLGLCFWLVSSPSFGKTFSTIAQDSLLIAYDAKNLETNRVEVTLLIHFDTLEYYIYSERLEKVADKHFEKKIKLADGAVAVIVQFFEKNSDSSFTKEEASVFGTSSVTFIATKPNLTQEHKILKNGETIPAHLRYSCTEYDLKNQLRLSNNNPNILGEFFSCQLSKNESKQDSVLYFFDKYASEAQFLLQTDSSLEGLFSLAMLQIIQKDEKAFFETAALLKQKYPTSMKLRKLDYLGFQYFGRNLIEDKIAYIKQYPFSVVPSIYRVFDNMQKLLPLETALKVHEHFSEAYQQTNTWQSYADKTSIFADYGIMDSVYYRSKEIIRQKKAGVFIESAKFTSELVHNFFWLSNIARYEFNKGNYKEAMVNTSFQYFFLTKHYKSLNSMQREAVRYGYFKAKIHLALNEKDSALQVYTELIKLTQADSIFDKIKSTYLEIHGSDSAYKDYLIKNSIDKFHKEIKYAPEASFKIYGTDEMVSLSSLKGKVVVLNFWGTYCKPCIKEMPELNDLKMKFAQDTDVIFIAPTKDNAEKLKSFFKNKKFNYQIAYAANAIFDTFNANFIPVNMVINRKGEIIFEDIGSYHDTLLKLNRAIEEALYAR